MSIFVEILIDGPMNEVWRLTQTPELHERWDLRFTSIQYLPRPKESEPHRFRYATRLGFGLAILGEGETVGDRNDSRGRSTSSLRFWSDDWKSLIREGSGYWQYVPTDGGVRFITGYNYQTRFGWAGRAFDRCVFRPLMGWATAWSFDRMRLWVEKGIDPAVSMQRSLIHVVCRGALALAWIYQGAVPKLIARHSDELAMLADVGIPSIQSPALLTAIGGAEVLLGAVVLTFDRCRWPMLLTICLMVLATIAVALASPRYLIAAFNPVSLNLLMAALAVVDLVVMRDLPSARRCLRKKPESV